MVPSRTAIAHTPWTEAATSTGLPAPFRAVRKIQRVNVMKKMGPVPRESVDVERLGAEINDRRARDADFRFDG